MRLRIGHRVFAASGLATGATLVLVALLLGLGSWQLSRMHEKRELFAAFESLGQRVVPIRTLSPEERRKFQRVSAAGRYDTERQVLLDNMTYAGRAGYQVLTPLVTDTGAMFLVNRGWIPPGSTRADIPDVSVDEGPRTITGRLGELPRAGIELQTPAPANGWPKVMSYPKREDIRAVLGRDVEGDVILLDADQPAGFVRAWRPATFPPERHLGYAVTWFALAATLILLFAVTHSTRRATGLD